jgi:hypothetical protein
MGFSIERKNRLDILVALLAKNNLTPNDNTFCDFILRASARNFGVTKETARGYIDTLISCWNWDKLKGWVKENPNLTPEEKERWLEQHE